MAVARQFADMQKDAAGSTGFLDQALRELRDISADAMQQTTLLGEATDALKSIQRDAADSSLDLMMHTQLLAEGFDHLDRQLSETNFLLASIAGSSALAAGGIRSLHDATRDANGGVRVLAGGFGILGFALRNWHWVLMGTSEFLAVALPAAIALSLGAFVMYQGVVEQVTRRLSALYTATESTGNMLGKTTGDVLGIGHAFQTAQDMANPIAWSLLGDYLHVAGVHAGFFAQMGYKVAQMLNEFGARVSVDLVKGMDQFKGLMSAGDRDLQLFGQVLGNIGHALLNFASKMPGLAEVLLRILEIISRVALVISEMPGWFITTVMVFEEMYRWGGLLASGFEKLGFAAVATRIRLVSMIGPAILGAIRDMVAWIGALGGAFVAATVEEGFLAGAMTALRIAMFNLKVAWYELDAAMGPAGWALLAIGVLASLVIAFHSAGDAAKAFGQNLEKGIASSSNVNSLHTIADSIGAVNQKLAQTPHYAEETGVAFRYTGDSVKYTSQSYQELSNTQQKMIGQFNNVVSGADKIAHATGLNLAQSLALADVAGVKLANTEVTLGKNANIAGQQIQGLYEGYTRMDQVGGTLGTDMNALAIQSGLAGTKVSQLNQALDQFVQNGTSVTQSFSTFITDVKEMGNQGTQAGQRFRIFSGQVTASTETVARQLESFSGRGAQAWQNYDSAINQAQTFTDALRTSEAYAGTTQNQFTGAIAHTVAALLPFAKHSQTARDELSMLAQEAGGPANASFKQLKEWVDKNNVSNHDFNKIVEKMTGDMTDAGKAAADFASTLQQQLQQKLADALLASQNLNGAVQQFQNAVQKGGGTISSNSPAYKHLYDMLTAAGLSAKQAKTELILLQNEINAMHGKKIQITTQYSVIGSPTLPQGTGGPPGKPMPFHGATVGFDSGGMVGGPMGMDRVPAWLTMGEAVLNTSAVAALGGAPGIHALNMSPGNAIMTGSSGGGQAMALNLTVHSYIDGSKVATEQRRSTLIYNRRNPSNNLALRVR